MAKLTPVYVRLEHSGGTVEGWLTWSRTERRERQVNDLPRITFIDSYFIYTLDDKDYRVGGAHNITLLEDQ